MPSKRPKCTHVVAAAVLGLEGSGKTTLVKQLRGHSETGALLAHHELDVTPTAGMELDTWQHGSTKIKVKDVGGAFAGSWPKYLKGVDTLVYVVDLSNPMQLGTATIELFHLLVDPGMARTPVLVVLSKGDLPATFEAATFRQFAQVDSMRACNPHLNLEVLEVTAFTGVNMGALLQWLLTHRRPLTPAD